MKTKPKPPLKVPEFVTMMQTLQLPVAKDFQGWSYLYKYTVTEMWTSIENSVDQAETAAIEFIKQLLTRKQAKNVKRAAYDSSVPLDGCRGVCRRLMLLLRELVDEDDSTNRLLLSWGLRLELIKVRDELQGRPGVPKLKAVVLVPQTKFTRRHIRYDKAGLAALLKWKRAIKATETLSSIGDFFNFQSAASEGLRPPHTVVSDGTDIQVPFERWRTRKRYDKDGVQLPPKAYMFNNSPAIISGNAKVADTVADVIEARFRGCAKGGELAANVRAILSRTAVISTAKTSSTGRTPSAAWCSATTSQALIQATSG